MSTTSQPTECLNTLDELVFDDPSPPTHHSATELTEFSDGIGPSTPNKGYSSSLIPSAGTKDIAATIPESDVLAALPTLLARMGPMVWPLSCLPSAPPVAMPVIYSAILPFARRNNDEITVFSSRVCEEPVSEHEANFRAWVRTQDCAAAYDHWISRSERTQAVRLQESSSRSRARQLAYMQRRNRCTSWSYASPRVRSPLRFELHEHTDKDLDLNRGTCIPDAVEQSDEEEEEELDVSDSGWGEDWDESLSFSCDDYEGLGEINGGESESKHWREKPMPLDERYNLVYGPSIMFGPRAASLMGFPESYWALWLPSETEDNMEMTADADYDFMSAKYVQGDLAAPEHDQHEAEYQYTRLPSIITEGDPETAHSHCQLFQSLDTPVCATRLAVRAHTGRLLARPHPSPQTRAAASLHLKLAAWVLTTIKLYDDYGDEMSGIENGGVECENNLTERIPLIQTPFDLGRKRAREEDSVIDEDQGTSSRWESSRPMKRIHLQL